MKLRIQTRLIYILLSLILVLSNVTTSCASALDGSQSNATEDTADFTTDTSETDWPTGPNVTARSAIIMEANTGVILYEKEIYEKHYPASITKILTSLVAIENSSLSDTVTFSQEAVTGVDIDSSRIGITAGEQLTMEDCLYAILLASANEVSYAVAEHVGGSMENFVKMMNERAKELNCVNSNFVNSHGLHDDNHYTCAYDMALISRAAIKNTVFAKITGTRTYVIPSTNLKDETRPVANHHDFINRDIIYDGAIGGKTGYTSKAKYTLVTYAVRGDMELICVVMASESVTSQYTDTTSLLNYGFDNFTMYDMGNTNQAISLEDTPFFTKYSSIYNKDSALLTTADNGFIILPNHVSLEQATKQVEYNSITNLVDGPNTIGTITYTYNDKIVGQSDIIYNNNTATQSLPTSIDSIIQTQKENSSFPVTNGKRDLKPIIVTVIILILITLGVLYYLFVERPRIRRRKAYYKRRQMYRRKYNDKDYL